MNAQGNPLSYGAPSHLYYAQRLYQFPLGIFGISLATAIFPVLSADAARKDFSALCATLSKGLQAALFVAVPATAGLILVARPVVAVVFQHGRFEPADTAATAWTLSFYALGLTGFFAQQIVIRTFYSLQNSKLPAVTAVIAVVVNLCLNLILIWPLGSGGLALATSLCSYLQVAILMAVLSTKIRQGGRGRIPLLHFQDPPGDCPDDWDRGRRSGRFTSVPPDRFPNAGVDSPVRRRRCGGGDLSGDRMADEKSHACPDRLAPPPIPINGCGGVNIRRNGVHGYYGI